jgi:hypothetical protein
MKRLLLTGREFDAQILLNKHAKTTKLIVLFYFIETSMIACKLFSRIDLNNATHPIKIENAPFSQRREI